ncbi:MAG: glycosyltransferase family 2 protein [Actinobacteria bacterium]|nr:glycosyltransferase family 2 protein [Actinomycetota bacterium]
MTLGAVAVIAARNEGDRIADTVRAASAIAGIDRVYVVENGSTDDTVGEAHRSGAWVLSAPGARGKGDALEDALDRVPIADVYLFLDGDLGASAKEAAALVEAIVTGSADLAVAAFAPDARHGGFGLVKRTTRFLIEALTGVRTEEPMSGQRAMTRRVLESVRPLASGFGIEMAMTVDALRLGFRLVEVPVAMEHRYTGRDLAGFAHRGRQGLDMLGAWVPRAIKLR